MKSGNQIAAKLLGDNGIRAWGVSLGTISVASDPWFDAVVRQSRSGSVDVRSRTGFWVLKNRDRPLSDALKTPYHPGTAI